MSLHLSLPYRLRKYLWRRRRNTNDDNDNNDDDDNDDDNDDDEDHDNNDAKSLQKAEYWNSHRRQPALT